MSKANSLLYQGTYDIVPDWNDKEFTIWVHESQIEIIKFFVAKNLLTEVNDIHNMNAHYLAFEDKYYEYSTYSELSVEHFFNCMFSDNEDCVCDACIEGLEFITNQHLILK